MKYHYLFVSSFMLEYSIFYFQSQLKALKISIIFLKLEVSNSIKKAGKSCL